MRKGELIKLKWDSVDFVNRTINIIALNTKTLRPRTVGMTERVFDELQKIWELSPKNKNTLVFGIKDNFKKSFASACKDAKIEDFHFHDCRHTAITRLIQAGLTPMEVMKISGHSQMTTFARYVNPDTSAVQRIAERLSAFNTEAMNEVSLSSELPN